MKKENKICISAVIVAAGKGSRMNMDINKQYIEIGGIPVLARTIQAFEDCESINEVVLVVNEQDIVYCKQSIVELYELYKVKSIVAGGGTRQQSVYNGLCEVNGNCGIVLIHDGARPFVKTESLLDSINAAYEFGASCVAVPAKDTVKRADENGFVVETPDRGSLWYIQTPQTFSYPLIMEAHRKAAEDNFTGTDDAVLVERLGHPMKLVMGSYDNIKITTKEDLAIAEAIVSQ